MAKIFFSNSVKNRSIKPEFFKRLISDSLESLKVSQEMIVDIAIVSESEIKRLNKKYRGKDKPTDVLSFSFIETVKFGSRKGSVLKSTQLPYFLGIIMIRLPAAKKRAETQNISLKENLGKLAIHGLLHLLGYDHEKSDAEKAKMEKLEKTLWQKANTL